MPRTAAQVNLEYTNQCARLGDLQFKKTKLEQEIAVQLMIVARLNEEAATATRVDPLVDKASEPTNPKSA